MDIIVSLGTAHRGTFILFYSPQPVHIPNQMPMYCLVRGAGDISIIALSTVMNIEAKCLCLAWRRISISITATDPIKPPSAACIRDCFAYT